MSSRNAGSTSSHAAFDGRFPVNGPGHEKMSVSSARSINVTVRANSGMSRATSRILGMQLAPSVSPSNENIPQKSDT